MDNPSDPPAIAIENLHKRFGDQQVLDGVTLAVRQGETVAVLGRSGTGKSVLLKLIAGLQTPNEGSVHIHGRDIAGLPLDELNEVRLKIGFLFQEAALYDSMSIEDNVAFPLKRRQKMSDAEVRDRTGRLLEGVGMRDAAAKMPSDISGGMKKRAGLARALALDPDILLFDEPTAGLDPITAEEIEGLIVDLKKTRHVASIVVTHDLRGAKSIADRAALLNDGRVVVEGRFEDLEASTDAFVSHFLKAG
jgi:phospholipid/cholesterol/gamma-HCH transport system ATP-binding protein